MHGGVLALHSRTPPAPLGKVSREGNISGNPMRPGRRSYGMDGWMDGWDASMRDIIGMGSPENGHNYMCIPKPPVALSCPDRSWNSPSVVLSKAIIARHA